VGYGYQSTMNITNFTVTNAKFFVVGYNFIGGFVGQAQFDSRVNIYLSYYWG